jgi:hypothetical protein
MAGIFRATSHPLQALRRARRTQPAAISASAVACSPPTARSTWPGALSSGANNGRSVGAGRGAGGVKREAETLAGKTNVGAGATPAGVSRAAVVGEALGDGMTVGTGSSVGVAMGVALGVAV